MNRRYESTAIERVKTLAPQDISSMDLSDLRAFMDAKGFNIDVVARLGATGAFAPLFRQLVLRSDDSTHDVSLNHYAEALGSIDPNAAAEPYTGSDAQNGRINQGLVNSGISTADSRFGEGTASRFRFKGIGIGGAAYAPIAVIGYGVAGILVCNALRRLGFNDITVFEKSKPLGVWSYENVYQLSRNNPLRLQYFDGVLEPAPGGGSEVKSFLERAMTEEIKVANVQSVKPGNFAHSVSIAGKAKGKKFPIVINAVGLGKPKPVSDPQRMSTETGAQRAGMRWQMRLDREKVAGKTIVLIGLGNSTAEMLRQIHELQDDGYGVDYRIITHYPIDAVQNPARYVTWNKRSYRVFRDLSRPNLVDYQGDLSNSRYDYFRALHGNKIIPGIKRWEVEKPGHLSAYADGERTDIPYDMQMTLIGYHQSEDSMCQLGCSYDTDHGCGIFDYDGEMVARKGAVDPAKRLRKGYYGFGSILETPENPNAIVIPGMLYALGDLLFGIVMRATEYETARQDRR